MSEYQANQELKAGAANVRQARAVEESKAGNAVYFAFRCLVLAVWGAQVYTVAAMVLS